VLSLTAAEESKYATRKSRVCFATLVALARHLVEEAQAAAVSASDFLKEALPNESYLFRQ